MSTPVTSTELERIDVLGDVDFVAANAITLDGPAARDIADSLGQTARSGIGLFQSSRRTVYELVPTDATRRGIADGTLRWAKPRNGDASVLIRHRDSGKIAGHGKLKQVKPKPASILGPAVWQAMAVATQQHYLAEINAKLAAIDAKLDEVLARLDDDARGKLVRARELASRTATANQAGQAISWDRVEELDEAAARADEVWHTLHGRAQRHVDGYRESTVTADELEVSCGLLLDATAVLVACADAMTALPHFDAREIDAMVREEGERVLAAMAALQELGEELSAVNAEWAAQWREYRGKLRSKKLVRFYQHKRPIKRLRKPAQETVEAPMVTGLLQATTAGPEIEKLLVEVTEGSVRVGVRPAGRAV